MWPLLCAMYSLRPKLLQCLKKVNVPNEVAGFSIDKSKIFFENPTVRMERDTTN